MRAVDQTNCFLIEEGRWVVSFATGQGAGGNKGKPQWINYADLMKAEAEKLGGAFKPFDQRLLLAAWANLSVISDVKKGVCRALSAVYLCRQYTACFVKGADGSIDAAEMQAIAMDDPPLAMSSRGRFFDVFKEGRLSHDEYQGLRTGSKVERAQRPEFQSGLAGPGMRGHLVIKKDGKWLEPRVRETGTPARRLGEPWRVRRIEHVAEVHQDTRHSLKFNSWDAFEMTLEQYQDEMTRTMGYFSKTMSPERDGVINLPGPYSDWIWSMDTSQGFFMCWVADHVLALAMRTQGSWNGYTVKFFDPNYGECKFKTPGDFQKFVGQISNGFCRQYHQTRMDYKMFS